MIKGLGYKKIMLLISLIILGGFSGWKCMYHDIDTYKIDQSLGYVGDDLIMATQVLKGSIVKWEKYDHYVLNIDSLKAARKVEANNVLTILDDFEK